MNYNAPISAAYSSSTPAAISIHQYWDNFEGNVLPNLPPNSAASKLAFQDVRDMTALNLTQSINPELTSDSQNIAPEVVNDPISLHRTIVASANSSRATSLSVLCPSLRTKPVFTMPNTDLTFQAVGNTSIWNAELMKTKTGLERKAPDVTTTKSEERKLLSKKRNRQSAAGSRERKKRRLQELKRRLKLLPSENSRLEQSEVDCVRDRLSNELGLIDEGKKLKRKVKEAEDRFRKVEQRLALCEKCEVSKENSKRIRTLSKSSSWDNSAWGKSLRRFPF